MPNPTEAQTRQDNPLRRHPRPHYLLKEMFGRTHLSDPYLYVTDGGHFDNLGLVELLRRGCTTIFCLDGGGDPGGTFRALGEAVALARSELQVDVEIDPSAIAPDSETRMSEEDFVLGTYRFRALPEGETDETKLNIEGTIVYCRAAVTKGAPWDVRDFHQRDKRFPYHSTMDQLFTDEKFESYRTLGAHTARRAVAVWRADPVRRAVADVLRTRAREQRCVSHRELFEAVREDLTRAGLDKLSPLLEEIAREEKNAHRPPLVLLVRDGEPPEALSTQLEEVYSYWKTVPDWGA